MKRTFLVLIILTFAPAVYGQSRCECEYDDWVDDCEAEFERNGDWIVLESDTEQCSRIDWYTGSQPRTTIVEDGKETVHLASNIGNVEISIASCKVCKDRLHSQENKTLSPKPDEAAPPPEHGVDTHDFYDYTAKLFTQCGRSETAVSLRQWATAPEAAGYRFNDDASFNRWLVSMYDMFGNTEKTSEFAVNNKRFYRCLRSRHQMR